jgi:hypothetical protein
MMGLVDLLCPKVQRSQRHTKDRVWLARPNDMAGCEVRQDVSS